LDRLLLQTYCHQKDDDVRLRDRAIRVHKIEGQFVNPQTGRTSMIIKSSRVTAIAVAFAVWLAYTVPAGAVSRTTSRAVPAGAVQTDDDDDDHLSGGALAVLLLAIGGAVAGVLYAAGPHGAGNRISCDRVSNEVTVRMNSTDTKGKTSSSTLTGKLDEKTGTITLIRKAINAERKVSQSQWTGKADGKYYSVTGDPTAEAVSYTRIDANTLAFNVKKADHVRLTGRMIVSNNSRTLTISTERTDSAGRRTMKQTVFNAAR
jgi:hypothetical protein